jgi:hypothetical protein
VSIFHYANHTSNSVSVVFGFRVLSACLKLYKRLERTSPKHVLVEHIFHYANDPSTSEFMVLDITFFNMALGFSRLLERTSLKHKVFTFSF